MAAKSIQKKAGRINVTGGEDPANWSQTIDAGSRTSNDDLQIALKVATLLQSSLNAEKVVNLFARELQAVIPHDGLSYYNETHELAFNMGRSGQHSCTYRLNADDKSLGEFALSRERRFSQSEIGLLERLLRSLVYPLRNALLYRDAASAAIKDPLTGIFNRAMLETALVREIGLARRHQDPFSVIMLDIDRFKEINDNHGHGIGDNMLKYLATCLAERIRSTDILARYGGEEFTVLLSHTDLEGALTMAERLRKAIQEIEYTTPVGEKIALTASLGVATFGGESAEALLARADEALYEAKRSGRNCVKAAKTEPNLGVSLTLATRGDQTGS